MTAAIEQLHRTVPNLVADDAAIEGVAPVADAHVNSLGRYELNQQPRPAGQLRPLRLVENIDRPSGSDVTDDTGTPVPPARRSRSPPTRSTRVNPPAVARA
jgi:hypothetical protein